MPAKRKSPPEQPSLPLPLSQPPPKATRVSAFDDLGFQATIDALHEEIRELYSADEVPWIIGYSGGKDSTAVLQLIWNALEGLQPELRKKTVHVITTDTLVENPIVATWVERSHGGMRERASANGLPIKPRMLRPKTEDSFWVNLIGKGYPAPRHKFRWCTERLKIKPSNAFISKIVSDNGEAILCIGARSAESAARAKVLEKNTKYRVKDRLSPSATLAGVNIYTPIESWTNDDVWIFLNRSKNPWGISNKDLMRMYAGASADGECPLVVDESTPSCGDSRFGCWVCTLVEQDRSMTAMIQNDVEKDWMAPLLDLRNALDFRTNGKSHGEHSDHHLRDFRRMTGNVQITTDGVHVPGPYKQDSREEWLRKLLQAQTYIRKNGPVDVRSIELITPEELREIRRIWVVDKHEMEDSLPRIYLETTGEDYEGEALDDDLVLGPHEMLQLKEICGDDRLHYELTRELLSHTRQQQSTAKRSGLTSQLERSFGKHFYDDREDAMKRANELSEQKKKQKEEQKVLGIRVAEEEPIEEVKI
jgi:DNA sulfur modification protein DndC